MIDKTLDLLINWLDEQIEIEGTRKSKNQYNKGVADGKIKAYKDTKIMLEFAKYSQSIVPLSMDQIRERKCQE